MGNLSRVRVAGPLQPYAGGVPRRVEGVGLPTKRGR